MKYHCTIILKLMTLFCSLFFIVQSATAGMTISGTRIIFPGVEREHTVRTNNRSSSPLLVQVWVDDGNKTADINSVKVPFTVTPPVYRVEPGKGQSVRLIYNGMNLPQDRESVFWFNMLEIPPENDAGKKIDQLELAFRTRIKIFYRPAILKSSGLQNISQLKWEVISLEKGIRVNNPTPYYISFDTAYINAGGMKYPLTSEMIAPFSSREMVPVRTKSRPTKIDSIAVRLINDYGSVYEYKLTPAGGNSLVINKVDNKSNQR